MGLGTDTCFHTIQQRDRETWCKRAEFRVYNECTLNNWHGEKHVAARRGGTRHDHDDTRGMPHGIESELFEDGSEQHSLFETIATPPRANELPLQAIKIEADGPTQEHVEILERNRRHVRAEKPTQCVVGWAKVSVRLSSSVAATPTA